MEVAVTEDILRQYDIASSVDYVCSRGFKRVTLQFPDELCGEAVSVATALESGIRAWHQQRGNEVAAAESSVELPKLFVLADTTFSSCCVDEVRFSFCDSNCNTESRCLPRTPFSTIHDVFCVRKACKAVPHPWEWADIEYPSRYATAGRKRRSEGASREHI
jgi:hypothetical protein